MSSSTITAPIRSKGRLDGLTASWLITATTHRPNTVPSKPDWHVALELWQRNGTHSAVSATVNTAAATVKQKVDSLWADVVVQESYLDTASSMNVHENQILGEMVSGIIDEVKDTTVVMPPGGIEFRSLARGERETLGEGKTNPVYSLVREL